MPDQPLDPRLNAYRPDLADARLRGWVEAERFVPGESSQVVRGVADLRREPCAEAVLDSQLLFGERVRIFERRGDWAWVQNETDGYVGYMPAAALGAATGGASHSLRVARSFLYPRPDLKAPPLDTLSIGSRLTIVGKSGAFSQEVGGGWVYSTHLAGLDTACQDYAATAELLLGAPYLWGGRSSLGLDCSALVQLALDRAGIACLRDSVQQEATVGAEQPLDRPPERGDLIYFPDHVAIALNAERVVHATAHAMLTTVEPLRDVVARAMAQAGRGITAIRRPTA